MNHQSTLSRLSLSLSLSHILIHLLPFPHVSIPARHCLPLQPRPKLPLHDALVAQICGIYLHGEELFSGLLLHLASFERKPSASIARASHSKWQLPAPNLVHHLHERPVVYQLGHVERAHTVLALCCWHGSASQGGNSLIVTCSFLDEQLQLGQEMSS